MVILLSILLLLLLVYYGYITREGLNGQEASKMAMDIGNYNQVKQQNKKSKTENDVNADETLRKIKSYGITDKDLQNYIMDEKNPDANSQSRLGYIEEVYTNRITECGKYQITNEEFGKLLRIILDESGESEYKKNTDKVNAAREIVKNDPRFEYLMNPENFKDDRDDVNLLKGYKDTINSILQKKNEC
jgi:hypothetical protein